MTEKTDVPVVDPLPFEDILRTAWVGGVRLDYRRGLIGTERALQASLYFHLRALGHGARVYIEPRLPIGHQDCMPDICVLLPDKEECWILELKLQNAASQGVVWEADFEKFARIEDAKSADGGLTLSARGRQGVVPLPIKKLRYAFVVVGDKSCGALDLEWLKDKGRAAQLLRNAAGKTFWLGGITNDDDFRGPFDL